MEVSPRDQNKSFKQKQSWLFKENWESIEISQGLGKIKRKARFIASLTTGIPQWTNEIQKRSDELQYASKLGRKAFSKIVKLSDRVTGREIGMAHMTPKVVNYIEQLKKNPLAYNTRILLLHTLLENENEYSLTTYRNIYLQACTVQCLGYWSSLGLLLTLKAQKLYVEKLILECRNTKDALQKHLALPKYRSSYAQQNNKIRELIHEFDVNEMLLTRYLELTLKNLREDDGWRKKFKSSVSVSIKGLTELGQELSGRMLPLPSHELKRKQEQLFLVVDMITLLLRHIPVLLPTAEKIVNTYQIEIEEYERGAFLNARILKTQLLLNFFKLNPPYSMDERAQQKIKRELHTLFLKTFDSYQQSLEKLPELPQADTEQEMLYDYCYLLSFYYNQAQQNKLMKQTEQSYQWFFRRYQKGFIQMKRMIPRLPKKKQLKFKLLNNHLRNDLQIIEKQLPGKTSLIVLKGRTMKATAPMPINYPTGLVLNNGCIRYDLPQ